MKIDFVNLLSVDECLQQEIRHWRNSKEVARYFQLAYIDTNTHQKWLESLKEPTPKNMAYLIKIDSDYIGLVYFLNINTSQSSCSWGIYIYDTTVRRKGVGRKTLEWSINFVKNNLLLSKITLEVLKDNAKAIALYEKMGFVFKSNKDKNVLQYEMPL